MRFAAASGRYRVTADAVIQPQTHPVVSQQVLQLVPVPLGHVPDPGLLQFGQELFEGGGAEAVPAGRVSRTPLHDLLLQDLLNSVERLCFK